jgi:hypothetical protein
VAPLLLQEPKHVALGLRSRARHPRAGGYPRSGAVRKGDQSDGDRSYRTLLSKHWRRERQSITPKAALRVRLAHSLAQCPDSPLKLSSCARSVPIDAAGSPSSRPYGEPPGGEREDRRRGGRAISPDTHLFPHPVDSCRPPFQAAAQPEA